MAFRSDGPNRHLLGADGVVAVVTFGDYGELLDFEGQLDAEAARLMAFLVTARNVDFALQAEAVEKASGMAFLPFTGWVYRGQHYSLVVSGNRAVVAQSLKADYNRIFALLEEAGSA